MHIVLLTTGFDGEEGVVREVESGLFAADAAVRSVVTSRGGAGDVGEQLMQITKDPLVDAVLVIGGDGLRPTDTAPEQLLAACGGRTLHGLAEPAYAAAGPTEEISRRGVAGILRSTVVTNLPKTGTARAAAALLQGGLLQAFCRAAREGDATATATAIATTPALPTTTPITSRPRESGHKMLEMGEALSCIETRAPAALRASRIPLGELERCVVAAGEAPSALLDHPPFPASVKDGYAVRSADGGGARLVVGAGTAGGDAARLPTLQEGEAFRISTGGAVPPGADAVVQLEDSSLTRADRAADVELEVSLLRAPRPGQDIRQPGSDIRAGDTLIPPGHIIGAAEIGLLASSGYAALPAIRRVRVAVFSSGDELVNPLGAGEKSGESGPPHPGKIFDSNRVSLLAAARGAGCDVVDLGIAPDTKEGIEGALRAGLSQADVVISSGGVSMGEKDLLKPCMQAVGAEIHFGRVEMKPGKPTTFATAEGGAKALVGLPGNPVSCLVCFHLFCVPVIRKLAGRRREEWHHPQVEVLLEGSRELRLDTERPEYHRAVVAFSPQKGCLVAVSTGGQISSRLLSLRGANGLLLLPKGTADVPSAKPGLRFKCVLFGPLAPALPL